MGPADLARFSAVLTVLAEHFSIELSERRIESYFHAMSDHELSVVESAASTAAKTCRFFPVPAELLDLIEGSLEDRAADQFAALVLRARGKEHEEIDDQAWEAVELLGGWSKIEWLTFNDCPSVDKATTRRDFLQLYRVAAKRSDPRWSLGPATPLALPRTPPALPSA